uniref:Uncharacterized protein n=1 Tax=Pfiesteria piscicida TaxID=71001 RepID=A3E3W2_PFIPI|nr:unknown [Pfiesteria piscicida]
MTAAAPAAAVEELSNTPAASGLNYGIIVCIQLIGCAICLLLAAAEYAASLPGADVAALAWAKDRGWWIVPAPFFPAALYFGMQWSAQRPAAASSSTGVCEKAAKKDQ